MHLSEMGNNKELTSEEKCIAYLERMRWPKGVTCPQCGNNAISNFQTTGKSGKVRHLYQCLEKGCRYQFSVTTGTIFHDSHLPLSKWFSAIALLSDSAQPISANQLRGALGVQYKTAVHVMGRIRQAMSTGSIELSGEPHKEVKAEPTRAVRNPAKTRTTQAGSRTQPATRHPILASEIHSRREETAAFLKEIARSGQAPVSPTAIDNMLSMFISLAQLSVKPPLFFVNYLKDKVFT